MRPTPSSWLIAGLACAVLLSACGSDEPARGRGPGPGAFRGAGGSFVYAAPIALVLTEHDSDRDRRITRAELDAAVPHIFADADGDRSGHIAALEFQAWARAALGSDEALPGRLAFDTDIDGIITREELARGFAAEFARLDKDGNGALDRSELVAKPVFQGPPERPGGGRLRMEGPVGG